MTDTPPQHAQSKTKANAQGQGQGQAKAAQHHRSSLPGAATHAIASTQHPRLGEIHVIASKTGVTAVRFGARPSFEGERRPPFQGSARPTGSPDPDAATPSAVTSSAIADDAARQLCAYLEGEIAQVDVPIDWSVLEPFQADVLRRVAAIPPGGTRTYGQLANELERPGGARAVGAASAANPMPLVLPCHRVVAADGGMGGYSGPGGVETKAWLLRLEGSALL